MEGRLYKSSSDKVVAGVCGGIGKHLGVDSTLVRLLWAFSIVFLGFGFFVYIICALIIPNEPNNIGEQEDNKDTE